jgi:hypothetical protein
MVQQFLRKLFLQVLRLAGITLLFFIFFSSPSLAQYTGGSGDGFDVVQLEGVQLGIGQTDKIVNKFYPNPTKAGEIIFVEFNRNGKQLPFSLLNVEGKTIQSGVWENSKKGQISTQGLVPGTYNLQIGTMKESYSIIIK